jgi:hypothetical protein
MKVTFAEATDQFELILIFDNEEYRILNIKDILGSDHDLAEVRDDLQMFQTAKLNLSSSSVRWSNGVDLDTQTLYRASKRLKFL